MTKHLGGPSVLFAIGIGFANACGVANANQISQVRYEVSGPGVAEFIYYQTDTGQLRAVNAQAALVDGVHRVWRPGVRDQRTRAGPHLLQDSARRQRGEHRDGHDGTPAENRLFPLIRGLGSPVSPLPFNGEGGSK